MDLGSGEWICMFPIGTQLVVTVRMICAATTFRMFVIVLSHLLNLKGFRFHMPTGHSRPIARAAVMLSCTQRWCLKHSGTHSRTSLRRLPDLPCVWWMLGSVLDRQPLKQQKRWVLRHCFLRDSYSQSAAFRLVLTGFVAVLFPVLICRL